MAGTARWVTGAVLGSLLTFSCVPVHADDTAKAALAALQRVPALRGIRTAELKPIAGAPNAYSTQVGAAGLEATVFPARAKDRSRVWVLTFSPASRARWTARDLLPPDHALPAGPVSTVLGDLVVVDPFLLIAERDGEISLGEVPAKVRPQVQAMGLPAGKDLTLRGGVNVAARIRLAISGLVGDFANALGIAGPFAPLVGRLPSTAAAALLGQASGTTNPDEIDLALPLSAIAPPGLAAVLSSDPLTLTIKADKGKLAVGGDVAVHLRTPSGRTLAVKATVTVDPAPREGDAYVRLSGPVVPLAEFVPASPVAAFAVDSLDVELAIVRAGTKREPFFGFRGRGSVRKQPIDITGRLTQTPDGKADATLSIGGQVKIADLIGAPVPGLDAVVLERISIGRDRVGGTVKLAGKDISALVYTPPGKTKANFALGDPALSLSTFVPGLKGTPLDEIGLVDPVLIVVPAENVAKGLAAPALPVDLVKMLGGPRAHVLSRGIDLAAGINVLTSLDVARSKPLHALLDAVGVGTTTPLALTGKLDPEMFRHTPWGHSAGVASVARSFFDHLDLAIPLPALALPGAPAALKVKPGALALRGVQGKPWLGISTAADIALADRTLSLDPFTLTVEAAGVTLAGTVSGTSHGTGDARQLVHFPGLTVTSLAFAGHIDTAKHLTAGLTADASLQLPAGTRTLKLKVSLDSGDHAAGSVQVLTALKVNDFSLAPVPGIGDLTITGLTLTPSSVSGTVRFRNEVTTLVAWTPAGAHGHRFALLHDKLKIGHYVSAVDKTPLGDLELDRAALIYVPAGAAAKAVPAAALPDAVVTALGGGASNVFPLDLPEGVTVSALAKLPSGGVLAELLNGLGLTHHEFPLRGSFDPAYLAGAQRPTATGGRWPRFDVAMDFPAFRPPGTGDHVAFHKGRILARPNADGTYRTALACAVVVTLDPQHVLSFDGEFTRDRPGVLTFAADAKVPLKAPFGMHWLAFDELDVSARIDRPRGAVDVSLAGHTTIDGHKATVTVRFIEQGGKLQDVVFALQGRVPLKIVPGIGGLAGVNALVLVDPEVSRTHLAGEIDFRNNKLKAAMFSDVGGWNVLLDSSALHFQDLFPGLTHGPLKAFSLPKAALLVSEHGFTRPIEAFAPAIQKMLGDLGLKPGSPVIAAGGVNLLTTLDPHTLTGPLKQGMDHLGIRDPVVLGGAVTGIFGGPPSLSLQAVLPTMPTPPVKFLRTRPQADARLLLGLAPTQLRVGIGTDVNVHVGGDDLLFSADLGLILTTTDVHLDVTGRLQGDWHQPFGIKGLTVEAVSLTVGGDVTGAVDLAVGGEVKLGTNDVLVAAGASLLVEALGTPKAIGLVAKIDRLPFDAIIDQAMHFVLAEAGVHLPAEDHPRGAFELDQLLVAFMTPGVVLDPAIVQGANLQIQGAGLALAGRLKLDGRELGRVNGWASTQGLKVSGQVAPFDIGPVKVDQGLLDFQASTGGKPQFKLRTKAEPLGALVELDVEFDGKGVSFTTKDRIGGQFDLDLTARTTNGFSLKNNDFTIHADLKDDFVAHLRTLLAREVNAFFADLDRHEKALAADLDKARAEVATRQREEAATRREVQGERSQVVRSAEQVRAQLAQLDRRARGLRGQIARDLHDAESAVRRFELPRAAELRAQARLLQAEAAGVDASYAATTQVLKAVEAGAQDLPVDADARVLAALAAREAARAHAALLDLAVRAARAVIADLRDAVTRLEHADVLEVTHARVAGTLATTLNVSVDALLFGKENVTASGSFAPKNVAAKVASIAAVAKNLAQRLLSHKKLEHEHPADAPAQLAQGGTGTTPPPATADSKAVTPAPAETKPVAPPLAPATAGPSTPATPATPATAATPASASGSMHMTYERWMKDTSAGVLTPRSAELKTLDQAVNAYDGATDVTRQSLKADLRDALAQWKIKQGPGDRWRTSVRNKLRAVEILDAEVKLAPVQLTQQEKDALAVIAQQDRDNLAKLFQGKKLVAKTTAGLGLVRSALSTFKTARDTATQLQSVVGPPDAAAVRAVLGELLTADGAGAAAALGSLGGDIVSAASPFGALIVANDWRGAVKAWRTRKKTAALGTSFAPGDPTAAFEAIEKLLGREVDKATRKAKLDTATFAIDTVLTGSGVGAVGAPVVAAAKALIQLFIALHEFVIEANEAETANALIAQGKLDAKLFQAAPLLGAYMLAVSDTSAVINMTVADFGAPGWTFEIEKLVIKAQPVFAKATDLILAASYEIPELRRMKGAAVNRNATTLGLPSGKIQGLQQRVIDWINTDSSGRSATAATSTSGASAASGAAGGAPAAATAAGTPAAEPPRHMSYTRWMKETAAAGRRGKTLQALDQAVKEWGNAQDLAQAAQLKQRVREALGQWQVDAGDWEGSPVNKTGAARELLAEVNRPGPARASSDGSAPTSSTATPARATPSAATAPASAVMCQWLYRRDTRAPQEVFAKGFDARGTNMNLAQHVEGSGQGGASGYVSTTKDQRVAFKLFWQAHETSFKADWIYALRDCGCGVDVNRTLDPSTLAPAIRAKVEAYRYQQEVAVPGRIDARDIAAATQPRKDDRPPLIKVTGSMSDEEKTAFLNWPPMDQVKVAGEQKDNPTYQKLDGGRQARCAPR